jgi:aminopeptidase N
LIDNELSNRIEDLKGISEGFEMPGSTPQYPPSLSFKIDYMSLIIKPDLKSKSNNLTNCKEILNITAIQNIKKIELNIAEIKVHSVFYSYELYKRNSDINIQNENTKGVNFDDSNVPDKLIINLPEILKKGKSICIIINYSGGYDAEKKLIITPRSGFYFIQPDNDYKNKPYQAWTQGEATESQYWFPCLDYPEVKFPREIHVIVPEEYTVISNGISSTRKYNNDKDNTKVKKVEWIWSEDFNDSTYLTSVAIGEFAKGKGKCGDIPLDYYWSPKIEEKKFDPMLTFEDTSKVIQFIQEFLHTPYPYKKYSQVAAEDFDFGGMENTSCTTMDGQMLHDHNALPNYSFDKEVVVHELAHQWFGDLVTCRDWQHIWLNEGFATYFEALYVEQESIKESTTTISNKDEFQYYILTKIMDVYFNEAQEYKRPIVTNIYKHPDDLFDSHSYRKGASVLHMIRNLISDEDFRESLRIYLKRYAYKNAETDDLRKVFEEVSGFSLQEFFEQWVYREGHPILDIEYTLLKNQIKINIRQVKESKKDSPEETKSKLVDENEVFKFPLDIKLHFSNFEGKDSDISSFDILKNEEEITIDVEEKKLKELRYVSIDPNLKILKEIHAIKLNDELYGLTLIDNLKNQLDEGETVYERIQAARYIRKELKEEFISTLKNKILYDPFYGVSRECVSTLGSYATMENLKSKAYDILKSFFERDSGNKYISEFDLRIQTRIIATVANFSKSDSLKYLYPLVGHNNYYVATNATSAIGNIVSKLAIKNKISKKEKDDTIQFLKEIVKKEIENESFQNLRGTGAIAALTSFSDDLEEDTILDLADFLIFCSKYGNPHLLRTGAISALGNFLRYTIKKEDGKETVKFNDKVFEQLKNVIKAKRFGLQNTALNSLVRIINKIDKPDDKVMEAISDLTWIAEHDTDGWVRRVAETSLNDIRKWIRDWLKQPLKLEYKVREERQRLQEEIIQTRLSRMKLGY